MIKCLQCTLIFINPTPSEQEIIEAYPEDYRPYRTPKSRIHPHKLKRLHKKINYKPPGRMLDIGCGSGSDLRAFRALGWEVYGVDISQIATQRAREQGLEVITGTVFDARFTNNSFDIVRLRHVIEHLDNPKKTFIEIRRILKPNGRVFIITPNIQSITFWLFKDSWYPLDIPRHLYLFSPESLKRLAEVTGFKVTNLNYISGTQGLRRSLQRWIESFPRRTLKWLGRLNLAEQKLLKYLVTPLCIIFDILRVGDSIKEVWEIDQRR